MRLVWASSPFLLMGILFAAKVCHADPFTFRDDFETYSSPGDLKGVWDPNGQIYLGAESENQYLRLRMERDEDTRANVWISPKGDLTGEDLTSNVRCTAVNSGYAYFYVRQADTDYRSVLGYALSTGMNWATFTLSDVGPEDFVRFDGGTGNPDVTEANRLGLTFWVDTQGLGWQYAEVDNFAVTPEPSALLTLGIPSLFLSRAILRRRQRSRLPKGDTSTPPSS